MKIYSDRRFIPPGGRHTPMLAPFWGPMEDSPDWVAANRFDRLIEVGRDFFEWADDPAEADVVVLPGTWNHYDLRKREDVAVAFVDSMERYRKPLLVFVDSDRYLPVPFPRAVVFRTSMQRSTRRDNEHGVPAWTGDLLARFCGGRLQVRDKRDTPVVGFCGLAAPRVRYDALTVLQRSREVTTNFIVRRFFYGGSMWWTQPNGLRMANWNEQVGLRVRREFIENILHSDYVVCARGGGNFSHRFYETLILGRIPVFIDTDCVLPFHDSIDWPRLFVWCSEADLPHLPQRIAEFHRRLTPADFIAAQHACRALWEARLSAHGFFAHFGEHAGAFRHVTS